MPYDTSIVPSGSFVVEKSKPKLLEAYLGSCVGVTLVDRKSGVGGLYHILLPEPPLPETSYQREAYAASGLPIFLRELIKKGADASRLEAVLAGGALIAPAMEEDFYMNIGGRTLTVVENFLRERDIPIVYGETGGFFSCKMTLNLSTMETRVEPIGIKSTRVTPPEPIKLTPESISEVISRLSPIPQIALEILGMLRSGNYNVALISEKVEKDQVITAKLLGFCNSPYIASPVPITSIERAIAFLGERRLLQMLLSTYCQSVFSNKVGGYSMCRGGLFRHALVTAHIAETIAGILNLSEGEAYTGGLLHDIGKIVLDQYVFDFAPFFYRRALIEGIDLVQLEREYFGMDHTEAGRILAEHWHLPKEIADIISMHEDIDNFLKLGPMAKVIFIANIVASRFLVNSSLSSSTCLLYTS
ncbi:MAG: HDOD domain-containing protein, partial [Syntrophobacterales bacterium]|nr:HDOD domain-containing protein [Syntrophobacterales bacterium]